MPLESLLYGLIVGRLDGPLITSASYRRKLLGLVKKGISGFVVFGGKAGPLKKFISELQSESPLPLIIASDIEKGVAGQVEGMTVFPCQMAIASAIRNGRADSAPDTSLLRAALKAVREEAVYTGINLALIPVLDVNRNPRNPIICTRAFSDDPKTVSWFGKEYIRALEGPGLACSAKHFPGHGDTAIDSHIAQAVVGKSLRALYAQDLPPFKEAVSAGVSSIMVGHLLVPALDSVPATVSRKIITGLLRGKLGFKGVVLTDALNMGALKGIKNLHTECIRAGADILLHPEDPGEAVRGLKDAIKTGLLTEERIGLSLRRIFRLRAKQVFRKGTGPDFKRHEALSTLIRRKSITLLKGLPPALSLRDIRVVFIGEPGLYKNSILKGISSGEGKTTLIAVYTEAKAWKGTSGLSSSEIRRIKRLISGGLSALVSFGCPYVLGHFKEADALIAAYEAGPEAERAVLDCLTGKAEFEGRLPVRVRYEI